MGQNPTRLDREKIGEVVQEIVNKSKHTKNNQFGSRIFRDDQFLCI